MSTTWGLLAGTFTASFVEFVEALTIVLAMGLTRGWRSALAGTFAALVALIALAATLGYAIARFLPEAWLKLAIGTVLLVFGLQWLRKGILRSAGIKALHDEAAEYAAQTAYGQQATSTPWRGIDRIGAIVSFKGVFLEGAEVVVIVITFGLSSHRVGLAASAALAAGLIVIALGVTLHRPLSAVPENTLKYGVGLVLATYGTFWAVSGLGVLTPTAHSLAWPAGDLALIPILASWFVLSRLIVAALDGRPRRSRASQPGSGQAIAMDA